MQPVPRELAKIGPCGISCAVCRFCIHGLCECRRGEGSGPFDRAARHLCPVEQCTATRSIPFCARDCPDFPCLLLERTVPYRWRQLAPARTGADLGSSHAVPVLPGLQDASQDNGTLRLLCLGEFRVFCDDVELQDSDWGNGKGPLPVISGTGATAIALLLENPIG